MEATSEFHQKVNGLSSITSCLLTERLSGQFTDWLWLDDDITRKLTWNMTTWRSTRRWISRWPRSEPSWSRWSWRRFATSQVNVIRATVQWVNTDWIISAEGEGLSKASEVSDICPVVLTSDGVLLPGHRSGSLPAVEVNDRLRNTLGPFTRCWAGRVLSWQRSQRHLLSWTCFSQ